jgi:hypothetical protein
MKTVTRFFVLLFVLWMGCAQADIVIELKDVLYTADVTVLCQAVVDLYDTSPDSFLCSDTTKIFPKVFGQQLHVVILTGVNLDELVTTEPPDLNDALTTAHFFPDSRGIVKTVGSLQDTTRLVALVGATHFVGIACIGYWVYSRMKA